MTITEREKYLAAIATIEQLLEADQETRGELRRSLRQLKAWGEAKVYYYGQFTDPPNKDTEK